MSEHQGKRYDNIALEFSKMRTSFYKEQKYLDLLINLLKPSSKILDIGCGSGIPIAKYLIEKEFDVTGVDASIELLKIASNNCPQMKTVYGDVRLVEISEKFDAIVEWWCLFHLPKSDHQKMIARFSDWLCPGGLLEFTTGDSEYESVNSDMLNQELGFYSLSTNLYERYLKESEFKIILCESDQPGHLIWIAKKKK